MQIDKAGMDPILKLSGALRINVVEELRAALLEHAATASTPAANLSEVTECDAAGLQLLISATHSHKPFELIGISAAVREAVAALGLSVTASASESVANRQCALNVGTENRGCQDAL